MVFYLGLHVWCLFCIVSLASYFGFDVMLLLFVVGYSFFFTFWLFADCGVANTFGVVCYSGCWVGYLLITCGCWILVLVNGFVDWF